MNKSWWHITWGERMVELDVVPVTELSFPKRLAIRWMWKRVDLWQAMGRIMYALGRWASERGQAMYDRSDRLMDRYGGL